MAEGRKGEATKSCSLIGWRHKGHDGGDGGCKAEKEKRKEKGKGVERYNFRAGKETPFTKRNPIMTPKTKHQKPIKTPSTNRNPIKTPIKTPSTNTEIQLFFSHLQLVAIVIHSHARDVDVGSDAGKAEPVTARRIDGVVEAAQADRTFRDTGTR